MLSMAHPSLGQDPSSLSPEAGQEGLPPAMPQVRGGGPQVDPTPQPRMQVPSLRPIGPCPCPSCRQPCCGRAGEWSRKGTPEPSEKDEAVAAAIR